MNDKISVVVPSVLKRARKVIVWFTLMMLASSTSTYAVTFKIATLSPEGSGWMKVLRKHGKAIEQRTDGNVKFKFYPGGVMGDDKAVLRKMRVGQLHGAVVTSGGMLQVYPDISLYGLPLVFRGSDEIDAVRKVMDAKLMQGLQQTGYVGFGLAEVGFAYPMTQKRATSVQDMQKLKVWTPDNDPGALVAFDAFSISPIPLPMADVLAGLQTGLIDSVATPPIGAVALQWHTQVEYGLELPLLYVYGLLTMSERSFKKLSDSEKVIVKDELGKAVAAVDASARRDHESATAALANQGINWLKPSAEEQNQWLQLADEATGKLIETDYVSADLFNQMIQILQKIRAN